MEEIFEIRNHLEDNKTVQSLDTPHQYSMPRPLLVVSARTVDELKTALAHSEERFKALADRVASMEKSDDRMHDKMVAQVASVQRVEHLEKSLLHVDDRIVAL